MTKYEKLAEQFIKEIVLKDSEKMAIYYFARYLDQQENKECYHFGKHEMNEDCYNHYSCMNGLKDQQENKKEKIKEVDLKKLLGKEPSDFVKDSAVLFGGIVDEINKIIRYLNEK